MEESCRTRWVSNLRLPDPQLDEHPTEPLRPVWVKRKELHFPTM